MQYQPGETITVKFQETVDHTGCFQIAFSAADDQNFVTLKQIDDTQGVQVYTTQVTLPAGVSCPACTLQVRQLMLEGTANPVCAPNAAPPDGTAGLGSTYFSCADICVGPVCAEAGAPGPDAGATDAGTSSGGPTTVPTDGGGKMVPPGSSGASGGTPELQSGNGGGCSVGLGATTGASLVLTAGLFGLALARRRRRRGDA